MDDMQEYYHDDANVMYELARQFVESLTGKESKEELEKMVDDAARDILEQAPLMTIEYIKEIIQNKLYEKYNCK